MRALINMPLNLSVGVFCLLLLSVQLFVSVGVTVTAEKQLQAVIANGMAAGETEETTKKREIMSRICSNLRNMDEWQTFVITNITDLKDLSKTMDYLAESEAEGDLSKVIEINSNVSEAKEKATKIKEHINALKLKMEDKYCEKGENFLKEEIKQLVESAFSDANKCEISVKKCVDEQFEIVKILFEKTETIKGTAEKKIAEKAQKLEELNKLKDSLTTFLTHKEKTDKAVETVQQNTETLITNLQLLAKIKETKKEETEGNQQLNNGNQHKENDNENEINKEIEKIDQSLQDSAESTLSKEEKSFEDTLKLSTSTENTENKETLLETSKNSALCISVNIFNLLLAVCIVMLNQCVLFFF